MHAQGRGASGAGGASITAQLENAQREAQEGAAAVKVSVKGVKLVDPEKEHEQAKRGQAHLHYRLDDGPIIATTATRLDFHQLSPGQHTITVMLAGNNHQPLGPEQTLNVSIPATAADNPAYRRGSIGATGSHQLQESAPPQNEPPQRPAPGTNQPLQNP